MSAILEKLGYYVSISMLVLYKNGISFEGKKIIFSILDAHFFATDQEK
jgi:hypothetical protein